VSGAVLAVLRAKSHQPRERLLKVVDDLGDAQLAWRPSPAAHSIGFTLWHTARSDDNVLVDLRGGELEWLRGGYPARFGHPARGVGTGWDDERAAALPLPPKADLVAYVRAVFAALDAAVDAIDDERLETTVQSRFMGAESTIGEVVFVCMSHENRHLGEIEYIKGLQGMRGTATV
jgi:uncharacterized damage-inducible protein DinB